MDNVLDLPLGQITRNASQPRETFPEDYIASLAASIEKRGLLQPITVRPLGDDRYEIVAGECRFRAHQRLQRETVRCIVKTMDEKERQLLAIVENLQRLDMNPIEEARAFQVLIESGMSAGHIVEELGLNSQAIVRQRLELLNLIPEAQQLVASGQLPITMGWGIAQAEPHHQAKLLRQLAAGRLRTSDEVKHAGIALRDAAAQMDAFGDLPRASEADLETLTKLERKIESLVAMVRSGFKDGECVAARRVSPDRVETMIEQLSLIRKHVLMMEHALRRAAAQSTMTLEVSS